MTPAMAAALVAAQQHVLAAPTECSPAEVVAWGRNGCNVAGLALVPGQVDTDHAGRVQRAYSLVHASDVVVWVERWPLRANRLDALAAVYRDLLGMPCSVPCDELGQPEPPAPLVLEEGPAANRLVTAWKAKPRFQYGTVVRKPVPSVDDEAMAAAFEDGHAEPNNGPEAEAPVDADASPVHSSGTSLEEPSRAEEARPTGLSGAVDSTPTPPLTSHAPAGDGPPSLPLPSPVGALPRGPCGRLGPDYSTCVVCRKNKAPLGRSVAAETSPQYCDDACNGYHVNPRPSSLWPGETCQPPFCFHADEDEIDAPIKTDRQRRAERASAGGAVLEPARHVWERESGGLYSDGMVNRCTRCRMVIERGPLPTDPCMPVPVQVLVSSCFECESSPCVCHFTLLAPRERAAVVEEVGRLSADSTVAPGSPAGPALSEVAREAKAARHRWAPSTARHTHCERCGLLKGYPPSAVVDEPSWRMSWSADEGKTWTKGTKLPPCGERAKAGAA